MCGCGGFVMQQGIPLNDLTFSKMSKKERNFWNHFLKKAQEVIDKEDAKRKIDDKTKKAKKKNVILMPPLSLKSKYEEAVKKYDGRKYCQVRQLEDIFDFQKEVVEE